MRCFWIHLILVFLVHLIEDIYAEQDASFSPRNADYYYNRRGPYGFGYRFSDDMGSLQEREEETKPGGSKYGSYGYVDASGIYRKVDYVADVNGFRATVRTNEPGIAEEDPANVRIVKPNTVRFTTPTGVANGYDEPRNSFNNFALTNTIDGYFPKHKTDDFVGGRLPPKSQQNIAQSFRTYTHSSQQNFPAHNFGRTHHNQKMNEIRSYSSNSYSGSGSTSYYSSEETGPKKSFQSSAIGPFRESIREGDRSSKIFQDSSSMEASTSGKTYRQGIGKARRKRQRHYGQRLNSLLKIHVPMGVQDSHLIPVYRDR